MAHTLSAFQEKRSTLSKVQRAGASRTVPLWDYNTSNRANCEKRKRRREYFADIYEQMGIAEKVGDTTIKGAYNQSQDSGALKEVGARP